MRALSAPPLSLIQPPFPLFRAASSSPFTLFPMLIVIPALLGDTKRKLGIATESRTTVDEARVLRNWSGQSGIRKRKDVRVKKNQTLKLIGKVTSSSGLVAATSQNRPERIAGLSI